MMEIMTSTWTSMSEGSKSEENTVSCLMGTSSNKLSFPHIKSLMFN